VVAPDAADSLFTLLAENLTSLAELERPRPGSTDLAVEAIKRYMREGDRTDELVSAAGCVVSAAPSPCGRSIR
jgi:hypothetical protein